MRLALVHVEMNRSESGMWFVTAMYEAKGVTQGMSTAVTKELANFTQAIKTVEETPDSIFVQLAP